MAGLTWLWGCDILFPFFYQETHMPQLYEIPPELYNFDDIRIDRLKADAITHEEFMRLIRPDDPFFLHDGKITIITKEDERKNKELYIASMLTFLKDGGGIGGAFIYQNRDVFINVYPELKADIDAFTEQLKLEPCEGCALNGKSAHLVTKLFSLPAEGRDLSKIETLLTGPYVKYSMMKLRGEKYELKAEDIEMPVGMTRRVLPLKKDVTDINVGNIPEMDAEGLMAMDGCRMCVLKHISEAMVLAIEILQGYSTERGFYKHTARLIGNLSAGESECVRFDPELAMRIRILRLKIMGQVENTNGK
jgi:hypothetical protein